jgi:hypothetical protein
MEFYLSFDELLGKSGNPVLLIFVPVFFFITTVLEGILIMRQQGAYPWKNASVLTGYPGQGGRASTTCSEIPFADRR